MPTVFVILLLALLIVFVVAAFIFASVEDDTGDSRSSSSAGRVSSGRVEEPRQKLKQATALKRQGKIDEACEHLAELIRSWEDAPPLSEANVPEEYPGWKVYWKHASYLQKAGRPEEGWEVLQRLIDLDYPAVEAQVDHYESLSPDDGASKYEAERISEMLEVEPEQTIFRELGQIFDKVRLFCDREGRDDDAIRYGTLSYAAAMKSWWYDGQNEPVVRGRFEEETSDEAIREVVDGLLNDGDPNELREELAEALRAWINDLPSSDLNQLSNKVETAIEADRDSRRSG